MPLVSYRCIDGEIIGVQDCLRKCRMQQRCLTLPTLALIGKEREQDITNPKYTPSTTQLLQGTMYSYLTLTKDFIIDPDSRAFMLSGTKHHAVLESMAKELGLPSEVALSADRDVFDLLEKDENNNLVLTDYKNWGSYRVVKALGLVKTGTKPDPSGAAYKTTSKWGKAGTPKMVSVFAQDVGQADNQEVELQLNRYRIMLEELGVRIHRMQVQATVRDGGLAVATGRGITRNTYMLSVKRLDNAVVKDYFAAKTYNLLEALKNGWSEPCTPQESWDGIKCSRYCDVWEYCPKGVLVHKLDDKEE